jgi:hypothetical protein
VLPGREVRLDPALDLRDVEPELALPLGEAFLADAHEILAPLDVLLAQLQIRFEDCPGVQVVLALLELATAVAEAALELGRPLLPPLETFAGLDERGFGPDLRLQILQAPKSSASSAWADASRTSRSSSSCRRASSRASSSAPAGATGPMASRFWISTLLTGGRSSPVRGAATGPFVGRRLRRRRFRPPRRLRLTCRQGILGVSHVRAACT